VCLHCRHAERLAASQRRKKLAFRGAALGVVVAVVGFTGSLSANALRDRFRTRAAEHPVTVVATPVAATEAEPIASASDTSSAAPAPVVQQGDVGTLPAPLVPVIAMGRSVLRDSIAVVRTDSNVVLSFDTPMLRTRMPEKFENFLRSTLRDVYGRAIDSTLAKMPEGSIASQGNLIAELPTRGIHIPVSGAWTLDVYPETRPGQDGPLVIRYRAAVTLAASPR
jgi:hypothetical protein